MKQSEAYDLVNMLKRACPVDTGQLKGSIQPVHIEPNSAVVIIGNGNANTTINGKGVGVPSDVYAHVTNNNIKIKVFAGGKDENGKPKMKWITNRNYHWANDCIIAWAKKHAYTMTINTEEDDE